MRVRCTDCEHGKPIERCPVRLNGPRYSGHWRKCEQFTEHQQTCGKCQHFRKPINHCWWYGGDTQADLKAGQCPGFEKATPRWKITAEAVRQRLVIHGAGRYLQAVLKKKGGICIHWTRNAPLELRQGYYKLLRG